MMLLFPACIQPQRHRVTDLGEELTTLLRAKELTAACALAL